MSLLARCDTVVKNTPLWNSPKLNASYFLFIRIQRQPNTGEYVCPISEFIGTIYPYLKNHSEIVILGLENEPTIPDVLTEVPSLLNRESNDKPLQPFQSRYALKLWLKNHMENTAQANLIWNQADRKLQMKLHKMKQQSTNTSTTTIPSSLNITTTPTTNQESKQSTHFMFHNNNNYNSSSYLDDDDIDSEDEEDEMSINEKLHNYGISHQQGYYGGDGFVHHAFHLKH